MSGKSGQLLTPSFYDDCELVRYENGVAFLDLTGFGVIGYATHVTLSVNDGHVSANFIDNFFVEFV